MTSENSKTRNNISELTASFRKSLSSKKKNSHITADVMPISTRYLTIFPTPVKNSKKVSPLVSKLLMYTQSVKMPYKTITFRAYTKMLSATSFPVHFLIFWETSFFIFVLPLFVLTHRNYFHNFHLHKIYKLVAVHRFLDC